MLSNLTLITLSPGDVRKHTMKFTHPLSEIHTLQTDEKNASNFTHPLSEIHTPQTEEKHASNFTHPLSEIHTL